MQSVFHPDALARMLPLAAVMLACAAVAAPATHAHREIATAGIHADIATRIDDIQGVHLHLHHVVNCLVGPRGAGWNAAAEARSGNHCNDLGNGAIADSRNDPAVHRAAEAALADAQAGIRAHDIAAAHRDARDTLRALDAARRTQAPARQGNR